MLVDIRDGLLDLLVGGRIVPQVTFGHTHGTDVHGECGLHLRARMTHAVSAQNQFRGPSTQIDHKIRRFDVSSNDARRSKEAQIGFFGSGNHLRTHTENPFDVVFEFLAVFGIACGRCGDEPNAVHRMFGENVGEFASGFIGPFQRLVRETMGLVDILPESDHTQNARHDVFHAVLGYPRHLQTDGIRTAINAGNGNGLHILILLRFDSNGWSCFAHVWVSLRSRSRSGIPADRIHV